MNLKGVKQNRNSSRAAFTVADVAVAVLVLGTIGSAFCLAISSGFSMLQTTREDLRATQILMQKIEAVRLCTWSELTNFSFQESYDPLSGPNRSAGASYFGTVAIGPATSIPSTVSYAPNICQVTVNLNWTNYNHDVAIPHNRQMQTQVARYGLQSYIWGAIQ